MVYVLVLYAFMLLCMSLSFRAFMRHIRRELDAGGTLRAVCTAMVPAMLLGLPMALEVIRTVRFEGGMPIALDLPLSFPWLTLMGAACGLMFFGRRAWLQRLAQPTFASVGVNVTGLLMSAYMAFVAVDQMMFFTGEDSGMLNWGAMQELSDVEVEDVKCAHGVIVFRAVETGTATYRCPAAVVIRPHSASPFIPWPSYTEGDSQQLAEAIKALHKSAEKP
jgi:hypothetical protein